MAVLELRNVTLAFGGPLLLDGVDFEIEAGERVALLGRNGEGKSTLLRLVDGQLDADDGEVRWASRGGSRAVGTRAALLAQQVPQELSGEVFDVVADGLGELGETLAEYHHLSARLAEPGDHEKLLRQLEDVQHALEAAGGWQIRTRVETVLSRLSLPEDARIETLSGGLKRRVLLARALVAEPDLLMLDEPTNHLDIPSITGLEEILLEHPGAILFVTHDRSFLKRLATRIIELDRGVLRSYPGDYGRYLQRKEEELAVEEAARDRFDKKLAQEEVWVRQGLKARRTRNMGRVRALEKLRRERQERRERGGTATMRLEDAERSGKRVIQAKGVSFAYPNEGENGSENGGKSGGEPVVRDFSTRILRGDKVGIIGPNGSGKSTLLKLLLGELKPDEGRVEHGTRLEVAYFDQLRAALDDEKSVADNVAEGAERIVFQGKPRHVISYLESFLFPPSRARSPVSSLSGGERNRLLLAKLFTRPFNLLVLDEPTNDLDIETLELLEDLLVEFEGTLLLVSHDRAFLDNVVTSTLVLEGGGRVEDYVGGYEDYLRQRPADGEKKPAKKAKEKSAPPDVPRPKARKIGYKEKIELAELPGRIEALETEQAELHGRLADPDFYRSAGDEVAGVTERLESLERELAVAYERWETLEALAG